MHRWIGFGRFLLLLLFPVLVLAQADSPPFVPAESTYSPFGSRDEAEVFLRAATITKVASTKLGVTLPQKLMLNDGKISHAALFKTIDEHKSGMTRLMASSEVDFKDSWKFEVAAYEIDKLLGLEMVPVTVERIYEGHKGSLQLWLDGCMVEADRVKKKLIPPDSDAWNHQMFKVRLFDNLVYNIDRNLGNLLISADWKMFMIDHSRTFKNVHALRSPKDLSLFSRSMLDKMKALDRGTLREHCGRYLSIMEIDTMLKRRDLLLKLYEAELAAKGEAIVYP